VPLKLLANQQRQFDERTLGMESLGLNQNFTLFLSENNAMSTAQAFYEIYKSLPKKTRKEVLELLQDEIVMVSRNAVTEAAIEIRRLKSGQTAALSMDEFFRQLKS
jgi:hypothetical protein